MVGYIPIEVPSSCGGCEYFETIMNEPLTINYNAADKEPDVISGACRCRLAPSHRMQQLNNGYVMEQITHRLAVNSVSTEAVVYSGRADFCPIVIGEIKE